MKKTFKVYSEKDLIQVIRAIKRIYTHRVFAISGELGVGKTTFIKHLINNLQSKNEHKLTEVPSPTFNIVNEYKIGEIVVNHYDLVKIKDPKELYNIGIFEDNSEILTLVEWPEIISDKPKKIIELYFTYEDDFQRRNLEIFSEYKKEIINAFK